MAESPISTQVRDLLIDHIDGTPVTLRVTKSEADRMTLGERRELALRRRVIGHCIVRGFLRTRVCDDGVGCETTITDKGRMVLAQALGDWADAIVRASDDPTTPLPPPPPLARWWAFK
jgi:hypothetical protein